VMLRKWSAGRTAAHPRAMAGTGFERRPRVTDDGTAVGFSLPSIPPAVRQDSQEAYGCDGWYSTEARPMCLRALRDPTRVERYVPDVGATSL